MTTEALTLLLQDHDWVQGLVSGDVMQEGLDLVVERGNIGRAETDDDVRASEISFSKHIHRMASGDNRWIAIPAFVRRGFCHRFWYVRGDSGYQHFRDLSGKRIGTNAWLATGDTWARAAARAAGVDLTSIRWTVGPIDGGDVARTDRLPPYVRYESEGVPLAELLMRGDLDGLVCPDPPEVFYGERSAIVRLIGDYPKVEREYYLATGSFPAHHIVGLRREYFTSHPEVAKLLLDALNQARLAWTGTRLLEGDTSPWVTADLEDAMLLMGADWQPYGVQTNHSMIQHFCDEMLAQGLIERRLTPEEVFPEYSERWPD